MMPAPHPEAAAETQPSLLKQTVAQGGRALVDAFSNRTSSSQFNRRMTIVVATLFTFDVVLAALFHLNSLDELKLIAELFVRSPGMILLIGACWYCRWRGEGLTKLGDFAQLAAWCLLVIPAISYLIPVAGRSPFPLVDGGLSRIDAALHFQTSTVVHLVAHRTQLRHALNLAYNSLPLLVVAGLVVPTFAGHVRDSRRFVLAVLIGAVFTGALFALWPAAGPWVVQGYQPSKDQASVMESLAILKSGQPIPERLRNTAVVAFPSFHVVLAVLSAVGLWGIRWARWFGVLLATAIFVSTLTTGWHYGIDLIAGLLVSYLAQLIANRLIEGEAWHTRAMVASKASA